MTEHDSAAAMQAFMTLTARLYDLTGLRSHPLVRVTIHQSLSTEKRKFLGL